ncbi:MAG TPA: AraC family transcriptional regulator [Thermoanaerobaculia bacterium]
MSKSGKKSVRQRANEIRFSYIISHYLRECYATRTPARVATLARLLGGNRPTLSRTITQYLGKPLKTVMRERQVKRAARLLRSTNLPLSEVAARSAFGDRTTLHRAIRSAFGVSPTEYRAQFQR